MKTHIFNNLLTHSLIKSIEVQESNNKIHYVSLEIQGIHLEMQLKLDEKDHIVVALDVLSGKMSARIGFEKLLHDNSFWPGSDVSEYPINHLLHLVLRSSSLPKREIDERTEKNVRNILLFKYNPREPENEQEELNVGVPQIRKQLPLEQKQGSHQVKVDSDNYKKNLVSIKKPTEFFATPPQVPPPAAASTVKIPDEYFCPITLEVMKDPVLCTLDSISYEDSAIRGWLTEHRTSPSTRKEMSQSDKIDKGPRINNICNF